MRVNWSDLEKKWRDRWSESADFETNPNDMPKKFITVAYPYPNSPQHIGHGRTYTLADVHARFYRMTGNNVLFPMAFHYTGTPILGMAKRIQAQDAELVDNLKNLYHVPAESIKEFVEPVKIADYFHKEIKAGMIEMGYSIDWRREFTTIDPGYKKFIEWQVNTLRKKNLIIQGSHPVGWCPKDQNPVSQHDTMGDVEPDFTEYTLVKFTLDDCIIPTATLRPETIFGVSNLWVNPDITYCKVIVDGKKWLVSKECAYKLEFLDKKVTYEGEMRGSDLVGKRAGLPHRDGSVIILPASFVQGQTGTGMVMSVPAHAPFDYQALEDLKKSRPGIVPADVVPVSIIETAGYGDIPAKDAVEEAGITSQDDPGMEEVTKQVYSKEFYGGRLKPNTGEFAGTKAEYAKDKVRDWMIQNKTAETMLEMTNTPVRCRCGTQCVVKILNNQWFLNYGDSAWKESAMQCLESMNILPPEIRPEFKYVVGWLRERACARQHGLGTTLPWDENWIVESLSDSVIYMAYYTISRFIRDGTITAERLSHEFFDYVFLGAGDPAGAAASAGMSPDTLEMVKAEFEYFYPVDSRHSGRDLVPNHLTFFVLNHTAIFPQAKWPAEIVVNGSVLMNGSKMSKSMGNIIPLRQAIREHGADPIRLAIIISSELLQDADFNLESVGGIKGKLESMMRQYSELVQHEIGALEPEDKWIASKTQMMIEDVTSSIQRMRLREALHSVLFSFDSDLAWYMKRAAAKKRGPSPGVLHHISSIRVAMLAPFAPHAAEEMWERLKNPGIVTKSRWPQVAPSLMDPCSIQSEDLLRLTMDDIANILKVIKIIPKSITIYVAGSFKVLVYRAILEKIAGGSVNMGEIMKELISNPRTQDVKKNPDFVQKTIKDILSDQDHIRKTKLESANFDEKSFLTQEIADIARETFGAPVRVYSETDADIYDPKGKARHARPYKPALLIE